MLAFVDICTNFENKPDVSCFSSDITDHESSRSDAQSCLSDVFMIAKGVVFRICSSVTPYGVESSGPPVRDKEWLKCFRLTMSGTVLSSNV